MPVAKSKSKYKYVGPFYLKGHVIERKLYKPDQMTDSEIEKLMSEFPFTKKWWKSAKQS